MDAQEQPGTTALAKPPRWPWLCLAAAMVWVAVVRVPLVLNAESHLDSDLAVDGLTLLEATQGHWRLHFPGTPYMGTLPVLLSLPGAWLFGVNPSTLIVGGVIAYEAFVVAMFFLCRRVFGPVVAAWALVPMAFASVGTVWLAGRLTGGHMLTLAWHAAALAMVPTFGPRGGYLRALGYGAWCGLGLYLDGMFLMTLPYAGILVLREVLLTPGHVRKLVLILAVAAGFALGNLPREVGARLDPYDAYREQFTTIIERDERGNLKQKEFQELLDGHLKLLGFECLPRLIAGHRWISSDLPTAPKPALLAGGPPPRATTPRPWLAAMTSALALITFASAMVALLVASSRTQRYGVVNLPSAMLGSAVLIACLFVLNRNIFDSDNYRYLVYWLVPWSAGYGLVMARLWRGGRPGKTLAVATSATLAILFTIDTAEWYRGFGWLDDGLRPVRRKLDDPALDWLRAHPDADGLFGGYWDVYRYQFLLGGKPVGIPFPNYPDRYNASERFPTRQPRLMVARKGELGNFYIDKALSEDGRVLLQSRSRLIIDWPRLR